MKHRHLVLLFSGLSIAIGPAILEGQIPQQRVDLDAVYRLKDEGFRRSQVMELAEYLSDIHGPRLTGSPNIKAAADYVVGQMTKWGLSNVKLEPWGPFAPGWTNDRFVALALTPQAYPLIGYPKAWSPGTDAPVIAEAVMAIIETEEDFAKYRGKLRGKFVLTAPVSDVPALFTAPGRRYTDADLADMSKAPTLPPRRTASQRAALNRRRLQFFLKEEVAALIEPGRGSGGTVFVTSGVISNDPQDYIVPPQVVLAVEHYNRIARTLARNMPVTLEFDIRNTYHDADLNSFTVIGEIPGTDKADEVVMVGAHLDSWHTGTGATDNAIGVAIVLEAMRLVKAAGLKPRRTMRVALWTGEEQDLLGSIAYVDKHFGNAEKMELKPEHAKLSVYFNLDNGAGAIRGVFLQSNEAVAPIFQSWMEPFRNLGMTTLAIRDTAGTDHRSFDVVGLPAFQFIQDPLEYDARTHHSSMDVYDRLQPADAVQNAVIVASFAYHAAIADAMLPRKPLPKPQAWPRSRTTITSSGQF